MRNNPPRGDFSLRMAIFSRPRWRWVAYAADGPSLNRPGHRRGTPRAPTAWISAGRATARRDRDEKDWGLRGRSNGSSRHGAISSIIATGAVRRPSARRRRSGLSSAHGPRCRDGRGRRPGRIDLAPIAEGRSSRLLARQADLRAPPHASRDQGRRGRERRSRSCPTRSRLGARQAGQAAVAGDDRHLHPSRLRAARSGRAPTTAGSAPATARSTTPPGRIRSGPAPENLPIPP